MLAREKTPRKNVPFRLEGRRGAAVVRQTLFIARAHYPQTGQGKIAAGHAAPTISVMEDLGRPDRRGEVALPIVHNQARPIVFLLRSSLRALSTGRSSLRKTPCTAVCSTATFPAASGATTALTRWSISPGKISHCPQARPRFVFFSFCVRSDRRGNLISAVRNVAIASVTYMKPAIQARSR